MENEDFSSQREYWFKKRYSNAQWVTVIMVLFVYIVCPSHSRGLIAIIFYAVLTILFRFLEIKLDKKEKMNKK